MVSQLFRQSHPYNVDGFALTQLRLKIDMRGCQFSSVYLAKVRNMAHTKGSNLKQ